MGQSQFSARRTDELEEMIQEVWSLRRELRDKNAQTIHSGLAALIRECKRSDATSVEAVASPEEEITDESEAAPEPEATYNVDDEWD